MTLINKQLAFSVEEYGSRIERVRTRMADQDFDALLLHTPENICYLSGYHTSGYYYLQTLIISQAHESRNDLYK